MENHKHKSISLADQIFEKLEYDILCGKYQRGEILTEAKLSEELGVSRTPIREALRRLSQEHIIEDTSKGSKVIGITEDDLRDIFKIRIPLEGIVVTECTKKITDEEIKELGEIVELQEFYIEKDNVDGIRAMDSKFHEMIYRCSHSTVFYDVLVTLHRKTQKFRRASVANHQRAEISLKEHKEIFNAIAKRDQNLAEALTVLHIKNARKRILGEDA